MANKPGEVCYKKEDYQALVDAYKSGKPISQSTQTKIENHGLNAIPGVADNVDVANTRGILQDLAGAEHKLALQNMIQNTHVCKDGETPTQLKLPEKKPSQGVVQDSINGAKAFGKMLGF